MPGWTQVSSRSFWLADGRQVEGRFAFDPRAFRAVQPTSFEQTRLGTSPRNVYRQGRFPAVGLTHSPELPSRRSVDHGVRIRRAERFRQPQLGRAVQ